MQIQHIKRFYEDLSPFLKPGKVLVIYGPRQVGKTTLLEYYLKKVTIKFKKDTGENVELQALFATRRIENLKAYLAGYRLFVLDEAQKIPFVGEVLKLLVDHVPDLQIIVTGSSSLELTGQIGEPLTGRKRHLQLYPISQIELQNLYNPYELKKNLEDWLIYGGYPEVITSASYDEKREIIVEIMQSYLLKDVLELDRIKSAKKLLNLLRLLAFQVGNEVSLNELGQQVGLDHKTVSRYLDLLEKSFVLFRLEGFSQNLRKEVTRNHKYYFYDNGIRNAIIANFNPLSLRDDIGKLWENFLVIERIKKQAYYNIYTNKYFWRTWQKQEIDWVEQRDGKLYAYEFKWRPRKLKVPPQWAESYENSEFAVISPENYLDFIVKKHV